VEAPRLIGSSSGRDDLRAEREAKRAHRRIIEIAIGDTADIVLAKRPRIHAS
jgi:hypothetical protein